MKKKISNNSYFTGIARYSPIVEMLDRNLIQQFVTIINNH